MAKRVSLFFILFLLVSNQGFANPGPKLVSVSLDRSFVPIGFDSNDRVQLVVSGEFQNTCYQVGPYDLKIDEESREIRVLQKAYFYRGSCLDVVVPFHQVVELGIRKPGNYKVIDVESKRSIGTIEITKATRPEVDDHPYAPVEDAFIVKDGVTGMPALVFWGSLPKDCYEVTEKQVEAKVYKDVVVILPVINRVRQDCNNGRFPFRVTHVFKEELPKTFLLHVRSMNGQAINKVISPLLN